jgi:uncharacterized DUF497 family protein
MKIIWNGNKAATNLKWHKVTFESAKPVFNDDLAITIEDNDHEEQRFVTIGIGENFILLVVVYCYPDETTIRLISARKAEPHERREYES